MIPDLTEDHCEPCEGGVEPMSVPEARDHMEDVGDWDLIDVPKIEKQYSFPTFPDAVEFVNRAAELAESEGHHPNLRIEYNVVTVTVWTHAVDGLTRNDFILAAKLDEIAADMN